MESEIIEILKNIEKRLETIEEHLGIVKEDCSKMGKHIHFVEKTYNNFEDYNMQKKNEIFKLKLTYNNKKKKEREN